MSLESRYTEEVENFGKSIQRLRKKAKLRQAEFGKIVLLTQSQISLIENGNSNIEFSTLVRLAWGLKVEIAELFNHDERIIIKKNIRVHNLNNIIESERKKFSVRLRELLEHRDIKQDALAVLCNMDEGDLSRFLNADHNIEFLNIVRLAEGLKVEIIDLFLYNGSLPDNRGYKRIGRKK